MAGAYGLDYTAAFLLGQALEADAGLLADVLPAVETVLVRRANGEGLDEDGEFGDP